MLITCGVGCPEGGEWQRVVLLVRLPLRVVLLSGADDNIDPSSTS